MAEKDLQCQFANLKFIIPLMPNSKTLYITDGIKAGYWEMGKNRGWFRKIFYSYNSRCS